MSVKLKGNKARQAKNALRGMLSIAAEMSSIVVQLRTKPKWYDYFAVGVSSLDVLVRMQQSWNSMRTNPWDYFDALNEDSPWFYIPFGFGRAFDESIDKRVDVTKDLWAGEGSMLVFEGTVNDGRVGWVEKNDKVNVRYGWRNDRAKIMNGLREAVWRRIHSKSVVITEYGLVADDIAVETIKETNLLQQLSDRVQAFESAGRPRSYLILGDPGTGKTTAIQYVIKSLDVSSLRIPLAALCSQSMTPDQGDPIKDLPIIVQMLTPEVVILNDIDRAPTRVQAELLDFLETARKHCKIVMASANSWEHLIAPIKRPKRFDDRLRVPPLGEEIVREILGPDDEDLVEKMQSWPIVFIYDYIERRDVLGREVARGEVPELEDRVAHNKEDEPPPDDPEDIKQDEAAPVGYSRGRRIR